MTRPITATQKGYVLILVLVASAVLLSIGISIASYVSARYQSSKRTTYVENAILAADAGVTDTLNVILNQNTFTGYTSKKQLYSDTNKGKAAYTTSASYNATTRLYTITSKGYAYKTPSDDDTKPTNTKTVEVTAAFANSAVPARVVVGAGGLIMNGGNIGGQNIWVNGTVSLTNSNIGASAWGFLTPTSDSTVNVAGIGCGTVTDYPIKCTGPIPGAGEPIQVSGNSSINGTVCANGQVTATGIYPGLTGQGLIVNCVAPTIKMPVYDRQALYNSMTQTKAGLKCNNWGDTRADLTANTLYTGNVSIGLFGACDPVIRGNVYIKGNLDTTSQGGIKVADTDSNGNPITTSPIVAVEGTINLGSSWGNGITANSSGVGPLFISFKSINATCNVTPSCNTLSTADLYNSVGLTNITISNDIRASAATFYSYFGTVDIQKGTVGAAAGQRIKVESNGNWSNLGYGGVDKDSFPGGDAFSGNVAIPVWNILTYKQLYP